MKTKQILILIAIFALNIGGVFAQGITNDGAVINVTSGTYLVIENGNYLNQTNTTDGRIDLDGTLALDGNFTNNAANNVFINRDANGTVVFNGSGTQTITSNAADMSNFIDFEAVTINSGSTTELAAGSAATTNGALTINGTFTVKTPASDATGGSLITATGAGGVTGSGTINVERYFSVNQRYQYISVPMDNQNSTILTETPNPGYTNPNFYTYFEGEDGSPTGTNYSDWSSLVGAWTAVPAGTMSHTGQGFSFYHTWADVNTIFTSSTPSDLNHLATYSPTVSFTSNDGYSDYFDGWNLVGNPYTSSIDWASMTLTNVDNTVYLWDGDLGAVGGNTFPGNYVYYNSSTTHDEYGDVTVNKDANARYISPMQGFIVKANAAAPSFSIGSAARLHNSNSMFKGEDEKDVTDYNLVKLRVENNGFYDETVVRFIKESDQGFDSEFDAYKMFPWNADIPMIYSLTNAEEELPLAINTLPISDIGTSIPLGFKTGEAGTYTIEVKELNFDMNTDIFLVDSYEDNIIDLKEYDEYTFTFEGDDDRTRFYLFSGPQGSGIEDEPINENINTNVNVWSSQNNIFITISSYNLVDANVKVFDMLGRTVIDKKLTGAYNIVNVPGASGTYFVKLRTKDGQIKTGKVFIEK